MAGMHFANGIGFCAEVGREAAGNSVQGLSGGCCAALPGDVVHH